MTREEFKAKVSMALGSMERETWEDFLEAVWQLHLVASNQWIPVEDELPAVGETVQIYVEDLDDVVYGALQLTGDWWCEEYGCNFSNIQHWMRKPAPPRKEGNL